MQFMKHGIQQELNTGRDICIVCIFFRHMASSVDAWNENPILKENSFNKLQDVMSLAGELEKKAPYDKIINNKYAEEAIK